jgi:hypothetical protein
MVGGHQVPAEPPRRTQVFDGPDLHTPGREVVERSFFGLPFGQIEVADGDDPVAPGRRQHGVQDLAESLEVEHSERDRHRHGDRTDRGNSRVAPQHAHAEFEVERDVHRWLDTTLFCKVLF